MATYVCSDIHGFYNRYLKMLKTLDLKDDDTLYVLGDCVDRGKDGIKILRDMMKRKNIIPFIGNHEFMMLNYIEKTKRVGRETNDLWLSENNGGNHTWKRYKLLLEEESAELIDYLQNAYIQKPIKVGDKNVVLCHTFFKREVESEEILEYKYKDFSYHELDEVVWYSPFRHDSLYVPFSWYPDEYTFFVGHVPTVRLGEEAPYITKNVIDIDGGCAYSATYPEVGYLCCIRLDDFFTADEPYVLKIR